MYNAGVRCCTRWYTVRYCIELPYRTVHCTILCGVVILYGALCDAITFNDDVSSRDVAGVTVKYDYLVVSYVT
jgi:hypothetical protein